MLFSIRNVPFYLVFFLQAANGLASVPTKPNHYNLDHNNRRKLVQFSAITVVTSGFPQLSHGSSLDDTDDNNDVVEALHQARSTLQTLLDNWSNAIFDCMYADVPRELLKTENKELLLEKAKTSALFDKSASITSCKTINNKVRDYIGVTGKGPVSVLPKVFKEGMQQMMDNDSIDNLDLYVQTTEEIEQELSKANSLSYEARRDYTSMNNFDESEKDKILADTSSNLSQAKAAIETAVTGLDLLIKFLKK